MIAVDAATDLSAGGGISIGGRVQNPQLLRADDLRKLPVAKVDVSYATGHGQAGGTFSGVLLWTILEKAVLVDGPGKGALVRHVITVTGRDGYAVVLSAGELAPDFEGKAVILALTRNGEPLKPEEGVRLIVPGDKHGGRAVRDVARIDVR
ncbi:MAG TPA: molybdopterin-dependent oxidoreductase [Candidatus Margulisiibacteriota bacterium]|nr:molybdopterin-dependent oxidoreductase [Candidatus Margulisiibacteriota bacterium]